MAVIQSALFKNLKPLAEGNNLVAKVADMLERADMFRDLSRAEIDQLAPYVQGYSAPQGAKVLEEGGRESYMFVIAEGKLDILKKSPDSEVEKKIATVRAGKTIGEMSLIDNLPQSATAIVTEPAKLLLISKDSFERFADECPRVSLKLLRKIAALMSLRLRQTSGVLIDYLQE